MNDLRDRKNADAAEPTVSAGDVITHYESLKSYFQWLVKITVSAIVVVGASVGFFFYKDMSAYRQDARDTIMRVSETVTSQMSIIKDEARTVALAEAKRRVDEAFGTTAIKQMIDSAARREVGRAVGGQVRREVDRGIASLNAEIAAVAAILNLGMKARVGLRDGLEELASKAEKERNENLRLLARGLLDDIADDYEQGHKAFLAKYDQKATQLLELGPPYPRDEDVTVSQVVRVIRTHGDLNSVTYAFLALRAMTDVSFRMFDFVHVEQWCKEQKPICE